MNKEKKGMISFGELMEAKGLAMPVMTVFLHLKFHTDEAVCWWMSRSESFREKVDTIFPGISKAEIALWSWGQTLAVEESADTLSFGCMGGRVDEHKLISEDYSQTCAADMFTQIAGLRGDAALRAQIKTVLEEDRMGKKVKGSIHEVLKLVHRMDDDSRPSPQEILDWVAMAYEAQYQAYKLDDVLREENPPLTIENAKKYVAKVFGPEKAEEWANIPARASKNAKARMERMITKLREDRALGTQSKYWTTVHCIVDGKRENVPMMVMVTDSSEAKDAALSLGATIIIIQRTTGNTGVFTDRRKAVDLSTVAMALRHEELERIWEEGQTTKKPMFRSDELDVRGVVKDWPPYTAYWYLHDTPWKDRHGNSFTTHLYNGTESAEVLPTLIPLEVIVKIVTLMLGGMFHPNFYKKCHGGVCSGEKCPWFKWDLGRCDDVKAETFRPKQQKK